MILNTIHGQVDITIDREPYLLHAVDDLDAAEAAEFDYLDEEERYQPRLAFYRGAWVDVLDFERLGGPMPTGGLLDILSRHGWQGIATDSAFSGMIVKFDDHEEVKLGWFYTLG